MTLKTERWPMGLILALFAATAVTWPFLPEVLPIHWVNVRPDGFASRPVALLFGPFMALVFYGTVLIAGREHELDDADHVWWWVRTIGVMAFACVYAFMQIGFWGVALPAVLPLGMAMIGLGSLRSFRPNALIGVRTKWTLLSDRSWQRSNRLFQQLSFLVGCLTVLLALFDASYAFAVSCAAFTVAVVGVIGYSYVEWRRDPRAH